MFTSKHNPLTQQNLHSSWKNCLAIWSCLFIVIFRKKGGFSFVLWNCFLAHLFEWTCLLLTIRLLHLFIASVLPVLRSLFLLCTNSEHSEESLASPEDTRMYLGWTLNLDLSFSSARAQNRQLLRYCWCLRLWTAKEQHTSSPAFCIFLSPVDTTLREYEFCGRSTDRASTFWTLLFYWRILKGFLISLLFFRYCQI